MTDTRPEIGEMVRTRLIALSGTERFVMEVRMCEAARRMDLASLAPRRSKGEWREHPFQRFQRPRLPGCIDVSDVTLGLWRKGAERV